MGDRPGGVADVALTAQQDRAATGTGVLQGGRGLRQTWTTFPLACPPSGQRRAFQTVMEASRAARGLGADTRWACLPRSYQLTPLSNSSTDTGLAPPLADSASVTSALTTRSAV